MCKLTANLACQFRWLSPRTNSQDLVATMLVGKSGPGVKAAIGASQPGYRASRPGRQVSW
jgi:hypothetical protein